MGQAVQGTEVRAKEARPNEKPRGASSGSTCAPRSYGRCWYHQLPRASGSHKRPSCSMRPQPCSVLWLLWTLQHALRAEWHTSEKQCVCVSGGSGARGTSNELFMSKIYLLLRSCVNLHDISRECLRSYSYSEEVINRQDLKLVRYVLWLIKKHMYATCSRLYLQAILFLARMERGKNSLGRSNHYRFQLQYERERSWRIAI